MKSEAVKPETINPESVSADAIFEKIVNSPISKLVLSAIVVLICFLASKIIIKILDAHFKNISGKISEGSKTLTYFKLAKSIVRFVTAIFGVLAILQIFEVNLTSLLTGVGIAAVIAGLIVQDVMKDLIRGISILSENYFRVGDVVQFSGITGEVISFGLTSTRIRDLDDSSVLSVANRHIEEIKVLSELQIHNIPLPYDVDAKKAKETMTIVAEKISECPDIKRCEYCGANHFRDSSVSHLLKVYCNPIFREQARREVLKVIIDEFDKAGICVPFNQLDIHTK